MEVPASLAEAAGRVGSLTRWERAELGRALRRGGWTYEEIRSVIPVAKATVAGWCRGIELTPDQIVAIRARTAGRAGTPKDTQWRRREEIERIRARALGEVPNLLADPLWVAGTALYWAEGFKTERSLGMANSDAALLATFILWTRSFHDPAANFILKLNLHAANDELAARQWWSSTLDLPLSCFNRTFIKPEGTGHRKNILPQGVCQIRMRRGADAFHHTMGWIDAFRLGGLTRAGGNLIEGR